jgi:DNA polymerase-1
MYQLIKEVSEMNNVVTEINKTKLFAFDTETTGLTVFDTPLCATLCWAKGEVCFIPLVGECKNDEVIDVFKSIMEKPDIRKIAHHMKFDMRMLEKININPQGCVYCTMLMHYLIDSDDKQNLKYLVKKYLNIERVDFKKLFGKKGLVDRKIEKYFDYACQDSDDVFELFPIFKKMMVERNLVDVYTKISIPSTYVFKEMEKRGMQIDVEHFETINKEYIIILKEIEEKIDTHIYDINKDLLPFNPNSPKQRKALLDEFGLESPKKTRVKKTSSTSADVMKLFLNEHDVFKEIYKSMLLSKRKSFLTSKKKAGLLDVVVDGRVHPLINQATTGTGRLSYQAPNLQNIPAKIDPELTRLGLVLDPKRLRVGFLPTPGKILGVADISQAELRVLAVESGDVHMLDSYRNKEDLHLATARMLYNKNDISKAERGVAKNINFAIVYGASKWKIADMSGISIEEAAEHIKNHESYYKGVQTSIKKVQWFLKQNGYVKNMFGRRRYFDINKNNISKGLYWHIMRAAFNFTIQGTVGDIVKLAMIRIEHNFKSIDASLLLQVHDELVFEASTKDIDRAAEIVKFSMENAVKFDIPFPTEVVIGKNWGIK